MRLKGTLMNCEYYNRGIIITPHCSDCLLIMFHVSRPRAPADCRGDLSILNTKKSCCSGVAGDKQRLRSPRRLQVNRRRGLRVLRGLVCNISALFSLPFHLPSLPATLALILSTYRSAKQLRVGSL